MASLQGHGCSGGYTGEELWMPIYSEFSGKAGASSRAAVDDDEDIEEFEELTQPVRLSKKPSIEL